MTDEARIEEIRARADTRLLDGMVMTWETVRGGVHLSEACAGGAWGIMSVSRRPTDDLRWCTRCASPKRRAALPEQSMSQQGDPQ